MKFCPECGSSLNTGSVKFCHNCGKNLWEFASSNITTHTSSTKSSSGNDIFQDFMTDKEELKIENGHDYSPTTVYNLGVKLEELVEKILKNKEYSTRRRLRLRGKSGALHEIDISATRKNKSILVECKNYEQNSVVSIKEIRDFHSKLKDLHHDGDALFVTYGRFSSDTITYANKYDIELWDGDKLSKTYISMLIGRHAPSSSSSEYNKIDLEYSLPISTTFEEVSTLTLKNLSIAKITGLLLFRPFYFFEYKFDCIKIDKKGKSHRIQNEDYCVLDAATEQILYEDEKDDVSDIKQMFFTKKSNTDKPVFEESLKKLEHSQICIDLKNIKPKINFKIQENPDYLIKVLEPVLSHKTASIIILEKIIQTNIKEISFDVKTSRDEVETRTMTIVPKKSDIVIKKSSLIYVPIWKIDILSHDMAYKRESMASSKTMILDEIKFCSKDFSSLKFWTKCKPTDALCDSCGIALCDDHVYENNEKYYCKDHSK